MLGGTSRWYWALARCVKCPDGIIRNVAGDYGGGGVHNPRIPDSLSEAGAHAEGLIGESWCLVCVQGLNHEAAALDPRGVHPYLTLYDEITPETVTAYAAQGATAGMMLCQLLALLAKWEPNYAHILSQCFGG